MQLIQPAPRVKNPVWKFTLWFLILVIAGQLLWVVFSIPVFRWQVQVETQLAREINTRRRNQITAQPRELPPDMRPSPAQQALQQAAPLPAAPPVVPSLAIRLAPIEPENHIPEVEKLLQAAREFRTMGDVILAREKLREAVRLEPKHPESLSELASLYESMNDWNAAKEAWHDLRQLGDTTSPLTVLAQDHLLEIERRETQAALERQSRSRDALPRSLTIAGVRPEADQGGYKSLRVTIAPNLTESSVAPSDVKFQVYFFEADAEKIQPARGTVKVDFLTLPINWSNGESEEMLARAGPFGPSPFDYYGYLIRVYYRGQLQDEVSDPPQLAPLFSATPTK